jgi:phospholipase C
VDGLTGSETQPVDPSDSSAGSVPVTNEALDHCPDDPPHGYDAVTTQINGGKMDGFVKASLDEGHVPENPISMFTPDTAPVINRLAEEFAVFDRWFASVPSSTDPNRGFAMGGTSHGMVTNFNGTTWPEQSHIDFLNRRGVSAGGYYQDDLWALGYVRRGRAKRAK